MSIRIKQDMYEYYNESLKDGDPIYVMPLYIIAAKHLAALQKEWEEYIRQNEGILPDVSAGETAYVSQIVLEMDGVPIGYVGYVDDILQFVPLHQKAVGEADRA